MKSTSLGKASSRLKRTPSSKPTPNRTTQPVEIQISQCSIRCCISWIWKMTWRRMQLNCSGVQSRSSRLLPFSQHLSTKKRSKKWSLTRTIWGIWPIKKSHWNNSSNRHLITWATTKKIRMRRVRRAALPWAKSLRINSEANLWDCSTCSTSASRASSKMNMIDANPRSTRSLRTKRKVIPVTDF